MARPDIQYLFGKTCGGDSAKKLNLCDFLIKQRKESNNYVTMTKKKKKSEF